MNKQVLVIIGLIVVLSSCVKTPTTIVNSFQNPQTVPNKNQDNLYHEKFSEFNKLNSLVASSDLTLEAQKLLKKLIQSEFYANNFEDTTAFNKYISSNEFQNTFHFKIENNQKLQNISKKVVKSRQEKEKQFTIINSITGGLELLYDAASVSATMTGVGAVAIGGIQALKLANMKGLEIVVEKVDADLKMKALKYFHSSVMNIKINRDELAALSKLPEEQALVKAEKLAESWTQSLIDPDMSIEERKEALSLANHYIAKAALENTVLNSVQIEKIKQEQGKNKNDLLKLSLAFKKFSKSVEQDVNEINESNKELSKLIENYSEDIRNELRIEEDSINAQGSIEFIKSTIEGKPLSPENKIEQAIDHKNKELWRHIFKYADEANSFVKLASNLGVDKKILKEIENANKFYQTGFEVYKNVLKGNFIESAAIITGLFGDNPMSMQDMQHREVIGKLDAILKGQSIIIQNQGLIYDGIKSIIANQELIQNSIKSVSEQISESTQLIYSELINIEAKIDYLTSGVDSILLSNLNQCEMMEKNLNSVESEIYGRYKLLIKPTNEFYNNALDCIKLQSMTYEQAMVKSPFYVKVGLNNQNASYDSLLSLDTKYKLYVNSSYVNADLQSYIRSANPVATVYDLLLKEKQYLDPKVIKNIDYKRGLELLKSRINSFVLIKSVKNLIRIHPYILVFRFAPHQKELNASDIVSLSLKNAKSLKETFSGALSWVRAALIQESNLYGDSVLTKTYDEYDRLAIEKVKCHGISQFEKIQCELNSNKALGHNFAKYAVIRVLKENDIHMTAFKIARSLALQRNDIQELHSLFTNKMNLKFQIEEGELSLVIAENLSIKVPTNDELLNGKMVVSPHLVDLLKLQNQLLQLITEIEMGTRLDKEERHIIYQAL